MTTLVLVSLLILVRLQLYIIIDRMMAVLLLLLVMGQSYGVDHSHLFKEHGFLAKDHGRVYLDTNEAYLSLVVHVALPRFEFINVGEDCHKQLLCGYTGIRGQKGCQNNEWTDALTASKKALTSTKSKIDRFNGILRAEEDSGREKRGIAGVLGIGVGLFSMLFSGISNARISHHLNSVDSDLKAFKSRQDYITGRVLEVQRNLVKVVDHRFKDLSIHMTELQCNDALLFQFSAVRFSLLEWQKVIDNYFYYVDRGILGGTLNSYILSTDDLQQVVADHSELRSTEYEDNLQNFYMSSKAALMEAEISEDNQFLYIHYILQTPLLYKANAHGLFKIEKVPISMNGKCFYVDSPRFMYKKEEEWSFIDLNEDSCSITDLVSVCYETVPQTRVKSSCLHDNVNCTFTEVQCQKTRYVYHYSGVLVSGQENLFFLKKSPLPHEARIISRKFSEVGVAWVTWKEAEYVQYGGMRVDSPSYVTSVVKVNYTEDQLQMWTRMLINQSLTRAVESGDFDTVLGQIDKLQQSVMVE